MRTSAQVAISLLLTAALAGGVLTLVRQPSPAPIEVLLPTPTSTPETRVYISGAVHRPGVYLASPEDRLEDVLEMAGGATADADLDQVNLALRVSDEAHFHVPQIGEAVPTPAPAPGKLNINTASVEELQALNGIGPALARTIVDYRQQSGPFTRVEDLLKVSGIGPVTLENLRGSIAVQ